MLYVASFFFLKYLKNKEIIILFFNLCQKFFKKMSRLFNLGYITTELNILDLIQENENNLS